MWKFIKKTLLCQHCCKTGFLALTKVYHTFHDEVDNYRVHWWLCNGPCRKRPPFFGYVKRAMNRPPSSRDPWWPEHQQNCGGVFEKVKEPEKKARRTNSGKGKENVLCDYYQRM